MSSLNKPSTNDRRPFHVELEALPYTLDRSPNRFHSTILFLLGFLCLFVITRSLMIHYHETDGKVLTIVLCVGLVSLAALLTSINSLTTQKHYIFHKDHVDIVTKNISVGTRSDSINYREFRGVMLDSYVVQRNKQSNLNFQTIHLIHPQAELTVPLYQAEGKTPPRDLWKKFTKDMRLSALEEDGDQLVSVAYDEIDLPLQQRSHSNFAPRARFAQTTNDVPDELAIEQNINQSEIEILAHRMPKHVHITLLLTPLPFLIAPFVMPFFDPNLLPELLVMLFLSGLITLFVLGRLVLNDIRTPRKLRISQNEMVMVDALSNNKENKNIVSKLPLNQIENILLKQEPNYIVIAGRQGEMTIGGGLSLKTLQWLQNYLRTAVVSA